jgi:hypothetical protein
MTTNKRLKMKGRKSLPPFVRIPHDVQDSENWKVCGGTAIKLLCALVRQYRGNNNGDLGASIRVLGPRGWRSSSTLDRSLRELEHYGFIVKTRQGGQNTAGLFAITWQPIDECGGKHNFGSTAVASDEWKQTKPRFKPPKKKKASAAKKNASSSPESGATRFGIRSNDISKVA